MFDKNTLKELGMTNLSDEQAKQILDQLNSTLQMRIGSKISAAMSDEQLAEFEKVIDKDGDEAAQKWVEANVADYKSITENEVNVMIDDIKAVAASTTAELDKLKDEK